MYHKIKYVFEAIYFLFFSTVFIFSFIDSSQSLIFKMQGIVGLIIVVFSIASLKDKIHPKIQNICHYVLGMMFMGILAYSFLTYYREKEGEKLLLYFSVVGAVIGFLRMIEFTLCFDPYMEYMELQNEQNIII